MSYIIERRTIDRHAPDNTRGSRPADWVLDALCAETDFDTFHPPQGGDPTLAKQTCALCPVRAACLDDIMRIEGLSGAWRRREGVYGGLTGGERGTLARKGWEPGDEAPAIRYGRPIQRQAGAA